MKIKARTYRALKKITNYTDIKLDGIILPVLPYELKHCID